MENFLNNCLKDRLVSDILGVQKDGHFFEANFILSNPIDFELDKDGQPSASTFKDLSKPQNHILQSLRFRTALQGSKNQEKTWFKLGLNLKVASLGIDLGRVEDASSLKLTDYVVNWYTPNGDLSDSPPNNYVPASFLFI